MSKHNILFGNNMRKLLLILFVVVFSGCSLIESDFKETRDDRDIKQLGRFQLIGDAEYDDVKIILQPLLIGMVSESDKIESAILQAIEDGGFNEEVIDELGEFMLSYYTEDIADETCNLLIYKFKNILAHPEHFEYLQNRTPRFESDSKKQFEIDRVNSRTQDRIELVLIDIDEGVDIDGKLHTITVILEREGTQWYLGDLVYSRERINGFGAIYVSQGE